MTFDEWLFVLGMAALALVSLLMFAAACQRENTRINQVLNEVLGERP